MKYQISIILSILASLTFGCEVSHPVDPAYDNCRQAGGTWQNSKCLCSDGVDTVCRNNKLYTCTYGLFDQGIDCPGVCKDDKLCVLELDNECDESGYTCNYTNINDQNLYKCDGGKLVLDKVCKNGCVDNKCVAECNKDEIECVGMYEKVCSEDGFWKTENYCPWGCDGDKCKCHEDDEICHNNTKYTCEDGVVKNKGPCDNACSMGDVKCTDEGKILQCTNGNWPSESHAVSGICEDGRLTICKENVDGKFVLNREICEKGCDETGKSCKQASDNPEPSCQEGRKECTNNTLKICKNGQWEKLEDCGEKGCKDNNSCHSSTSNNYDVVCSDGELTCIDMELKICEQGQWQLKEKCNDDSGTDMGFCYIDQCIKCEEIIGADCIGNMQSQIMCQTSEGRIPTQIDCAFGCTSNNDGYCEPCSESMPQKCESDKEYQCFNGMWQYTKTCALGCNETTGSCNSSNNSNDFNCNSILTDGSFTYLEVKNALFSMFGDSEQYANLLKKLNESIISEFSDKFELSCNGKWLVFEFENKLDSKMKYFIVSFYNIDHLYDAEMCEEDSKLYTILDSNDISLMDADYSSCDFNNVLPNLFADGNYLLSLIYSCTEAKLSVPDRTIMNCGNQITYLEQLDIKKKCDNDNSLNFEVSLSGSSESGLICR